MRYLAIDPGDRRTGLALGDDVLRIASPYRVIDTTDANRRMEEILAAVDELGPDALVLGLPLNMDGTAGPAAAGAQQFADELRRRTGLEVRLVDERLTSAAADAQMSQSGLTHRQKKRRRDALAAAAILRDFFHTMP